jgi:histone acetyltransferase (RNA polymerase elongator complex component)
MILPVFLPHLGCGHHCIYCNQNHITKRTGTADVEGQLATLFNDSHTFVEIALYGGNPLGMNPKDLDGLFRLFEPFVSRISSFRLSAKPGLIDEETVNILKRRGVRTIELGIPSFNDTILSNLQRGHTSADAIDCYLFLAQHGFDVGIQVMAGLPQETFDDVEQTAFQVVRLAPSFIRIYPLIVIQDTHLYRLFKEGRFQPDEIDKAVRKSAFIYATAWKYGIKTIKMGLTENDVLKERIAAGPFHPAFGYLVKSETFRRAVENKCHATGISGRVLLTLNHRDVPHLFGLRRSNIERLNKVSIAVNWIVDNMMIPGHFLVDSVAGTVPGDLTDALATLSHK